MEENKNPTLKDKEYQKQLKGMIEYYESKEGKSNFAKGIRANLGA
jgi:hypothetical protein